jgi:hypothetical protein
MLAIAGLALLAVDFLRGEVGLADIGTAAIIGGVLGETAARLGVTLGRGSEPDGWRDGMFFGGLAALLYWAFGELGA